MVIIPYFAGARSTFSAAMAVCALSFGACAADQNDSESNEQSAGEDSTSLDKFLVAEVSKPAFTLSFYETEPGSLLELERGELAARAAEPANLNAVQRYEFLTGEKAPAKLIAALVRATGTGVDTSVSTADGIAEQGQLVSAPESVDKAYGHTSEDWFRANYCQATDRTFGNLGASAGTSWTGNSSWRYSVKYLKGGVYNADGQGPSWDPDYDDLNYRMGYSGGNIPDQWYGIGIGMYAAWRNTSSIQRQASSVVTGAESNRYVHCLNYHF